jgi:uncharacterized protein YegL
MNPIEEIPEVAESRTFHQLGILLLDGSGSMAAKGENNTPLADHVNLAVREFLGFFKNSSQVNNFSIAVVTFDETATVHTPVTALKDVNDFADYNPMTNHGGGTFIGGALEEAEKLAEQFLKGGTGVPHDVRIIVMSDGLCQKADETEKIASRLKNNDRLIICSSLFTPISKAHDPESNEAKTVLRDIASAANLYKTTYKEADLRQFFISSMSAKRKAGND